MGLAALAGRRYLSGRAAMVQAAPELRSPILPFVSVTYDATSLPVIRRLYQIKTPAGRGVTVTEREVGQPPVRVLVTTPDGQQAARPSVLSIHGGGTIVGSLQLELGSHGRLARAADDLFFVGGHVARSGQLQQAVAQGRDELGVPEVTSHSFRKSMADLIDGDGLSARVGADQLGLAKISMTQDRYMSRGRIHAEAATLLDGTIKDE